VRSSEGSSEAATDSPDNIPTCLRCEDHLFTLDDNRQIVWAGNGVDIAPLGGIDRDGILFWEWSPAIYDRFFR
jgi:coproporphyrinogen III oxidase